MLAYIDSPFGMLNVYRICIFSGIACAVLIQALLTLRVFGKVRYLLLIAAYGIGLYFGQYAAAFVRGANNGGLDGALDLKEYVTGLYGTHFLGYLLFFSLAWYPLLYLVSSLVMEPDRKFLIRYMNVMAICFPAQHIFNRLGCLGRGCCYGIAYRGPLCLQLTENANLDHSVFPVQLLEIFFMAVILVTAAILMRKKLPVFGSVMILFGVTFFIAEFFTENNEQFFHFGLTFVQWFSILLALTGIVHIFLFCRFGKAD